MFRRPSQALTFPLGGQALDCTSIELILPLETASHNGKKPDNLKEKKQKAQEMKPKITESIEKRLMDGKDTPFNFEERLQQFLYHVAVLPSLTCGLITKEHLTVSGDGTAVHTHSCPRGHHRDGSPENLRHFPDPDASWG